MRLAAQRVAGCGDVTVEEVQEVLRAGSQPTDDPVEEIDREDQQHEEKSMEPRPIPTPEIAPSDVAAILMQLDAFKECVKEREPCPMRTKEICFAMDTAVRYYHEQHRMHIQNRKQSLITRFLGPDLSNHLRGQAPRNSPDMLTRYISSTSEVVNPLGSYSCSWAPITRYETKECRHLKNITSSI